MTAYKPNKLYKDKRNAMIMGVAAGVGDYFDVRVCVVRWIFVFCVMFTGGWFIALYVVMGFVLDAKPDELYAEEELLASEERYQRRKARYKAHKARHKKAKWERKRYWQRQESKRPDYNPADVKRRFDNIERRTRNLEAYMTSRKFRLDREIKGLED